ncbi:hypothetical protein CCZ01_09275 [Helicobacter monodelphidis]|uniref:DUF4156 domain-containing protein n=1 Tax=Helicobacter sp. 15-1451 TaxID=2004995 RepID=UPI000DCC0EBF|nr:DUF4156 domain-containing protein [Helicobacter sp. 15-1451]RAX56504.1 hypothetical protein CCZ01_09275 [Helicobacter sp. 15-1451]
MKKALWLIGTLMLAGCSTQPTLLQEEAKAVQIVYEKPQNCTYLGEVSGYKKQRMLADFKASLQEMKEYAKNDLRNNAHKKGGNIVFIHQASKNDAQSSSFYLQAGSVAVPMTGESYVNEMLIEGLVYHCP